MTRNVLTVTPNTPLRDVARLMTEHGISGVPVVEKGSVLGIVSESDIMAKERGPAAPRGRIKRWLARKPRSCGSRTAPGPDRRRGDDGARDHDRIVAHAPRMRPALMLDRRVHRVPVLKDGKLVGIVTRADLVSAFARSDEEIALDIRDDVLLGTFWITPGDVDVTVRNGEVTLRGTVESDLLTQLLPEAVQRVPGVVRVKSRLVARPTDDDAGRRRQLFRRV